MAIVTFMKNGISDEEMEIAKSELKSIFEEEKNVFTGIVFKWREVRGKEKGETLIAGNPEIKEKVHFFNTYASLIENFAWAFEKRTRKVRIAE